MRRLAAAAALLYSALHFAAAGVRGPLRNFYGDFLAAFPSWGMSLFFGRLDLYDGSLASQWGPQPIWYYGPVLHAITAPLFAFPSLRSAYVAWLLVNYAFLGAAAAIAAWIVDDGRPRAATIVVVIVAFCNLNPLYEALAERTIEIFELLLLFAAFAFWRHGRDRACGAAIGVAAMTKFLPLIFLPWFVLKRKWEALAAAIVVIVPIAFVADSVLGWENNGTLHQLSRGGMITSELDQSLAGFVGRFLASPAARAAAIVVGIAALCALMLRVRDVRGHDDLEWSVLVAAMVLLPPHNEDYYFIFLLFPYLMLYARYRARWSWLALPAAASFFLVAAPVPFSLLGPQAFSRYLQAGIPFAGAALLAAVLVGELSACRMHFGEVVTTCPSKRPSQISALS